MKVLNNAIESESFDVAVELMDAAPHEFNLNDDEQTPLHTAAMTGNVEFMRVLLNRGADVDGCVKFVPEADACECWPQTPLMAACEAGHLEAARFLVTRGANVDYCTPSGRTAFLSACFKLDNIAILSFLLDKGADVRDTEFSEYGWIVDCALSIAIRNNDLKTVKFLLKHGAYANMTVDEQDHNMLMLAAEENNADIVEYLLQRADVDVHEQLEGSYYERIRTVGEKTMDIARSSMFMSDDVRRRINFDAHKIIALLESQGVCMPSSDESDDDF